MSVLFLPLTTENIVSLKAETFLSFVPVARTNIVICATDESEHRHNDVPLTRASIVLMMCP